MKGRTAKQPYIELPTWTFIRFIASVYAKSFPLVLYTFQHSQCIFIRLLCLFVYKMCLCRPLCGEYYAIRPFFAIFLEQFFMLLFCAVHSHFHRVLFSFLAQRKMNPLAKKCFLFFVVQPYEILQSFVLPSFLLLILSFPLCHGMPENLYRRMTEHFNR